MTMDHPVILGPSLSFYAHKKDKGEAILVKGICPRTCTRDPCESDREYSVEHSSENKKRLLSPWAK